MLDNRSRESVRVGPAPGNGQATSPDSRLDSGLEPTHTVFEEEIEQTVPERFEKIVRRYPQRLAIKAGDRSLTYEALNQTANRIAHAILARRGPGSEPVALLFEQGAGIIASLFGVLKAGKFYVALDPSFPKDRNEYMLEDSQASLIVTNHRNLELARTLKSTAVSLLDIDEIDDSLSAENLDLHASPIDHFAIRYTSGSTGKPKGVIETHRCRLHNAMAHTRRIRVCAEDRLSLLHSVSFASGDVQLYRALLNGAALFPFDIKTEGIPNLVEWLKQERITIYHSPPAVFRQLAESLSGIEKFPNLRVIHLSGAAIAPLDFELYKKNFSAGTLFDFHMGSTESGIIGSAVVDRTFSFPHEGSPAGYPAPDKTVLLLDENGHQVGRNEVGEIAVKSCYLTAGYWNDPELTRARFLSDPSGGDERTYLTGDLGRKLPDGFVTHLGRKDFQVKIRGYRVELGEIERALLTHPQIKDAAVVAWDREPGEKYLLTYVVSRAKPAPTVDELYDILKKKLPHYMMPSAFMFLESLPRPHGKLDCTALPLPDHKRPDLGQPYAPPQGEIEKRLVQIWEEVLNVRPIGIYDNFFDLGGHSLLAAKLFVRLDDEFGRLLPLGVLFAAPTVRLLAEHYRSSTEPHKISPLVPLTTAGSLPPVYAVPGVFGNVIGLADLCRELGPQQPFYGLQSIGLDGAEAPLDSVEEMAKLYLSEIRVFQSQGPYALIGVCFGGRVAYEMALLLLDAGEEVAFLGLLDPIGLEKDETGENLLSAPPIFPRAKALSSFVTERLRLYLQEMRGLDNGNRIQFIVKKIRSLSLNVRDSKAMRSVRREICQLEVLKASKRAGERYYPKPIHGRLRAVEIFDTARSRNNPTRKYIDWNALWNGQIRRHLMPGKDSGDMVSGKNARVLAVLLAERMRAAFGDLFDKEARQILSNGGQTENRLR
jgi:amino acid adenylation domain-containing protein